DFQPFLHWCFQIPLGSTVSMLARLDMAGLSFSNADAAGSRAGEAASSTTQAHSGTDADDDSGWREEVGTVGTAGLRGGDGQLRQEQQVDGGRGVTAGHALGKVLAQRGNLQRLHQQLRKGPAVVFGHAALGRDANEAVEGQCDQLQHHDERLPWPLAEVLGAL
ncbi:unnamed protein product, partial [Cladocopium goreaui]